MNNSINEARASLYGAPTREQEREELARELYVHAPIVLGETPALRAARAFISADEFLAEREAHREAQQARNLERTRALVAGMENLDEDEPIATVRTRQATKVRAFLTEAYELDETEFGSALVDALTDLLHNGLSEDDLLHAVGTARAHYSDESEDTKAVRS